MTKEHIAKDPEQLFRGSRMLLDQATVTRAIDRWSVRVAMRLAELPPNTTVIALVVMRGGMQPAVWLLQRLPQPLIIDTVQVTRYHNQLRGEALQWQLQPAVKLTGRVVLLIDDIFDAGYTMAAIKDWCLRQGAAEVITTAMVVKQHERGLERNWLDLHALDVPDQYVFGCGMDVHGHWRHLPAIYVYQNDSSNE